MKPYRKRGLNNVERIFNYRLSRARCVVENAFGILVWLFRIFSKPINVKVDTIDKIIWAACSLHNWLRVKGSNCQPSPKNVSYINASCWSQYCTKSTQDDESSNFYSGNNYRKEAEMLRQSYADYFYNDGRVQWQWKSVGIDNEPPRRN